MEPVGLSKKEADSRHRSEIKRMKKMDQIRKTKTIARRELRNKSKPLMVDLSSDALKDEVLDLKARMSRLNCLLNVHLQVQKEKRTKKAWSRRQKHVHGKTFRSEVNKMVNDMVNQANSDVGEPEGLMLSKAEMASSSECPEDTLERNADSMVKASPVGMGRTSLCDVVHTVVEGEHDGASGDYDDLVLLIP